MQVRLLGVLHEIVRDGAEVHVHVQHVTSGTAPLFARIARANPQCRIRFRQTQEGLVQSVLLVWIQLHRDAVLLVPNGNR
jgi:hypothetical protein